MFSFLGLHPFLLIMCSPPDVSVFGDYVVLLLSFTVYDLASQIRCFLNTSPFDSDIFLVNDVLYSAIRFV